VYRRGKMKAPSTSERDYFQAEGYQSALAGGFRVQWDYRDKDGVLYSGIAKSYEEAEKQARAHGYTS
jgi:hypothetical protein